MTIKQEIYQDLKPVYPWTSWFKRIASRIIFPPVLLWDRLKFVVNAIAGNKVGELILPAQGNKEEQDFWNHETKNNIDNINKSGELTVKKIAVKTYDGAILDTIEMSHPEQTNIPRRLMTASLLIMLHYMQHYGLRTENRKC
jgi:hypothetical protein